MKKIPREREIIALLLCSRVAWFSIINAFVLSPNILFFRECLSSELCRGMLPYVPHHSSELNTFLGGGGDAIIDRQGFLNNAFWSTTSSSIAIASTPEASLPTSTSPMPTTTIKNTESICQNGALMGESAVPGAYSSACMGLPERIVPLPRYRERISKRTGSESLSSRQNLQPGTIVVEQQTGGSGNTGMTVWNSGLLLTRLLDEMVAELKHQQEQKGGLSNSNVFWENQDVIELGCGTGLCSIAAHRLGAKSVIATDGNPRVLQLAESNIKKNYCNDINIDDPTITNPSLKLTEPGNAISTIRAEPLQWGFFNAMDYSEKASFVIGADLTYNPGSWGALAETIATILKSENDNINTGKNGISTSNQCYALYLSVGHDGFNVNAEMDGFLSVAKEKGLVILENVVEGINLNELLSRTLLDSEKRILAQGGGYRVTILGRKKISRR